MVRYISLIILLSCSIWASPAQSEQQSEKIKVGVLLPLSGQYAHFGEDARRAILLNSTAGKELEYFFEDSRFSATAAISAYRKLKDINRIEALINIDSISFKALYPQLKKDKILTLQIAESTHHEQDQVFQIMPSSFPLYTELGREIGKRYQRIALIYGDVDVYITDAEFFKRGLASNIIIFESQVPSASDYRSLVSKMLKNKPQAVSFIFNPEDGVRFLKTLIEQSSSGTVKPICDANTALNIQQYTKALGKEFFEGCITTMLPDRMSPSFKTAFKEVYGETPELFADYAYDAATIISSLSGKPKKDWGRLVAAYNSGGASGSLRFDHKGTRLPDFEVQVFKDGLFRRPPF